MITLTKIKEHHYIDLYNVEKTEDNFKKIKDFFVFNLGIEVKFPPIREENNLIPISFKWGKKPHENYNFSSKNIKKDEKLEEKIKKLEENGKINLFFYMSSGEAINGINHYLNMALEDKSLPFQLSKEKILVNTYLEQQEMIAIKFFDWGNDTNYSDRAILVNDNLLLWDLKTEHDNKLYIVEDEKIINNFLENRLSTYPEKNKKKCFYDNEEEVIYIKTKEESRKKDL